MARNYHIFKTRDEAVAFAKDGGEFIDTAVQEGGTIIRNQTPSMVLSEYDAAIMLKLMPETDPEVQALRSAIRRLHDGFRWTVDIKCYITFTQNGCIVTGEFWLVQKDSEDRVCKKVCQIRSRIETKSPKKNALP